MTVNNSQLPPAQPSETAKAQVQALFRQIDACIKEGAFDRARQNLAEAKTLDPDNPFITAFSDRIVIFEKKKAHTGAQAASGEESRAGAAGISPGENLSGYYVAKSKELEERFKLAQSELLEREKAMLMRRELKVHEEFKQQADKLLRPSDTASYDPRAMRQRESERQMLVGELNAKMEAQLSHERNVFSLQYSQEHAKLQQGFLDEQRKLIEEQQLEMTQQIQNIRKREGEEFECRRQEIYRELEEEFKLKMQEKTGVEARKDGPPAGEFLRKPPAAQPPPEPAPPPPVQSPPVSPDEVRKIRQALREEMESTFLARIEQLVAAYNKKMDLLGFVMPQSKEEAISLYRKKLKECYAGGMPTVEQAEQLMEFKELLELTFDEHAELETSVRMELYVEHVEKLLHSAGADLHDAAVLDAVKSKFSITPEEASRLEPYFLSSIERISVRGRILLADDDPNICISLEAVLSANGYAVAVCESVPKAMEVLRSEPIDIIISDLKFAPKEPDGFQFFSMVQKEPLMRKIPFLLLSAMTDNVYIRTGVQLGVDDYLTKPIDPDFLVAVVEGKLKRFRTAELH